MDKSMLMKSQVLEMLKDFMMGEEGKKIKPKAISVEMVTAKPKDSLEKVLEEASEDEDKDSIFGEEDEDDEEVHSPRSLKDYFSRK